MKKVLHNNILAREIKQKTLDSGIVIADTVSSEKSRFEVVGIGPEVQGVSVGDTITVPSQIGQNARTILHDGEELTVLTDKQVVLVVS